VLLLVPSPSDLPGIRWSRTIGHRGVHFISFATLTILMLASRWPLRARVLAAVLVGYALGTEGLQWLVPQRIVEILDLLENLLGILVGAAIWQVARESLKNRG
jgi:VanZ family protein